MGFEVSRVTNGPKHHLFGFHDLVQTNAKGDLALSLEVEDISRPPLPGESCCAGVVPSSGGEFRPIRLTHTWNYPQGARQQWIDDSDLFVCNDRRDDGTVFAVVCDAREGRVVDSLPFPIHCLIPNKRLAIWQDYNRLHMVGGYGYVPFVSHSCLRLNDIPVDDGLWRGDLKTGERMLLVSIYEVAACGEKKPVKTGFPHYLTHAMLSPSGSRVAFLHRYRVADGGEVTRLLTIGIDGQGLRCLAKGFLSHFTWVSDDEIFIWGAHQPGMFAMREASFLRIPGAIWAATFAKKALKTFLRRSISAMSARKDVAGQSLSFIKIKDSGDHEITRCGVGVLTEDGHPMANPVNLHKVINDTYPNAAGVRTLMEYDLDSNIRHDIGSFPMLGLVPDKTRFDIALAQCGLDQRIIRRFDQDLYLYTRSGLHCDLHPRWSHDGKFAYFDSIHEGTRQVYRIGV